MTCPMAILKEPRYASQMTIINWWFFLLWLVSNCELGLCGDISWSVESWLAILSTTRDIIPWFPCFMLGKKHCSHLSKPHTHTFNGSYGWPVYTLSAELGHWWSLLDHSAQAITSSANQKGTLILCKSNQNQETQWLHINVLLVWRVWALSRNHKPMTPRNKLNFFYMCSAAWHSHQFGPLLSLQSA